MKFHRKLFFIFLLLLSAVYVYAQEDSSSVKKDTSLFMKGIVSTNGKDTVPKHSPRKATIRSAIIPGWGQIYNKKYWKVPLVYGALGTTAGIFIYNTKTYNLLKAAYINKIDNNPDNDNLIDPRFKNLSAESIRTYRNEFRQNIDYSV